LLKFIWNEGPVLSSHSEEISAGKRYTFGKNWENFLKTLDEERICNAEKSLCSMLGCVDLRGKRFLDIGSGSGLFSLAARRLGAEIHSFDYDPRSVACTRELKHRYFPGDENWTIEEGDVLDAEYLKSLGKFDIEYSWGVLHHTGNMYKALYNVQIALDKDGLLFIAIYNDQGYLSRFWNRVKGFYCSGVFGKIIASFVFYPYFFMKSLLAGILKFGNPIRHFSSYKKERGMSVLHDWKHLKFCYQRFP